MMSAGGPKENVMAVAFKRLPEVDKADLVELMNHPLVRRQMPLTRDNFTENDAKNFVEGKEQLWADHGYGPWAFFVDGSFAGWGGLQPEEGDADLGLVLHPNYWGKGKAIYDEIIRRAFGEMGFSSVIVLLPPSRTRVRGLARLGFTQDGELEIGGEQFIRYRLFAG
jgi:ribosomal-protein-alanine N-acetyltransferase